MKQFIVLLRGINVGGKNSLPMKHLSSLLMAMGCSEVKTYIQSGNVSLFHQSENAELLASEIKANINSKFGFNINVMAFTAESFSDLANSNPFKNAELEPKTLHVYFLAKPAASADLQSLMGLKAASETFELLGTAFYLHAPDGIGRSKLAAKVEKYLGVAATARNWNTVSKLLSMTDIK
ncbi:DUF1697 domain-containing protein [Paraglaciecola sp. 2405UD69-4]|uniref:DUF1697 domain-containing protein n=1 Tax=Paraglaciecola sp. 2405UD69-4 TaxID=3391836 RepID=UPI0039C8DF08